MDTNPYQSPETPCERADSPTRDTLLEILAIIAVIPAMCGLAVAVCLGAFIMWPICLWEYLFQEQRTLVGQSWLCVIVITWGGILGWLLALLTPAPY